MKVPKTAKITSRSSSITNAFIQAILPTRAWTSDEEVEALGILGMKRPDLHCAYCGSETSEWDHLFPLVRHKMPTGYIHELRNLVPACGRCNHSKSGADWNTWFLSEKANSPTRRKIQDREQRFERLSAFVRWGGIRPISLNDLTDDTALITQYWTTLGKLQADLVAAQALAAPLKTLLQAGLDHNRKNLTVENSSV